MMAILSLKNLLFSGDVLFGQKHLPAAEAGFVSALSTFSKITFWIATSISTVLFSYLVNPPALTNDAQQSALDKTKPAIQLKQLVKGSGLAIALSTASLLVLYVGGDWLIPLLLGAQYKPVSQLVGYLFLPMAFYSAFQLCVQSLMVKPRLLQVVKLGLLYLVQLLSMELWADSIRSIYLIQMSIFLGGLFLFGAELIRWEREKSS